MKYSDPSWVPPERWDSGVSGLIFDYNLTGSVSRSLTTHTNKHSLSAYGQTGFNLGAWRFRADYQANYNERGDRKFDWNQFYAYRPLIHMAAKLTLGEIYLSSQVFDTIRFTGFNLASDERMLPPNLRGYAPQINGIAKSNSKIVVTQLGVSFMKRRYLRGHSVFKICKAQSVEPWMSKLKVMTARYRLFKLIRQISLI